MGLTNVEYTGNEKGNVLFLILIAVALFAALSYAVTQSTQSGGGDAGSETSLVNSAQLTQYPASVRTSVVRMIIGGTDVSQLEFNPSSDFDDCTNSGRVCVFHPSGGGATSTEAPGSVMADGGSGTWFFNGAFEIVNIGISSASSFAGNEVMAFLPGITQSVCSRINDELGISGIPAVGTNISATYRTLKDDSNTFSTSEVILGSGGTAALSGQPFGCFQNDTSGEFVYYHVLVQQ